MVSHMGKKKKINKKKIYIYIFFGMVSQMGKKKWGDIWVKFFFKKKQQTTAALKKNKFNNFFCFCFLFIF